jgi:hypothetical protein
MAQKRALILQKILGRFENLEFQEKGFFENRLFRNTGSKDQTVKIAKKAAVTPLR